MAKIGAGPAYNPGHWNVYVQALNQYVYFNDQASAQADIQTHRYGQLMGPQGAAAQPAAQPAAPAGKIGEGPSYNPSHWNVHLPALNKFLYFPDQASAQADISAHGYGSLVQPNGQAPQAAQPAPQPQMNSTPSGAPPSSTGWWQVHDNSGKSWKFTDPALAVRCQQAVGGRLSANVSASSMPARANPQGPSYS